MISILFFMSFLMALSSQHNHYEPGSWAFTIWHYLNHIRHFEYTNWCISLLLLVSVIIFLSVYYMLTKKQTKLLQKKNK